MAKSSVIFYTRRADKDLEKIDRKIARRIIAKVRANCDECTHPLERATTLAGNLSNFYRYRVGNYRVIFTCADDGRVYVLHIYSVQHRKDIYR